MIESINLNLIPSGVSPVCHVSQYDAGRQIKINLFEGINPYTIQSGDSFTLNVRKPDNTIVTTSVSGTQGNTYVTISTTEQIAAVVGENLCELKITNGSTVIGTLNFIMQVERDVLSDGIPSQSVIEDLDERIAEAIGDNYYNKTETDALLALKADKTEFYNFYPTEQESGAIASFTDGAENIPVKSLVSQIVAVETGNGQPKSPTNPYSISGFDSGVITRCGKNFIDTSLCTNMTSRGITTTLNANGSINLNGTASARERWWHTVDDMTILLKAGTYTASTNVSGVGLVLFTSEGRKSGTFTITSDVLVTNINFYLEVGRNYNVDVFPQLEIGNQATPCEAYNGTTYTFAFGQTVYGGSADIIRGSGERELALWTLGTKTDFLYDGSNKYVIYQPTGIKTVTGANDDCLCEALQFKNSLGDYFGYYHIANSIVVMVPQSYTITDFNNEIAGTNLVYPLATPQPFTFEPVSISTLLGENNIFSDTGDVDVTIRADIGLYIDKRLNANRSTPNNLSRAASYVDDPESVNESQEDNVEPQNEER